MANTKDAVGGKLAVTQAFVTRHYKVGKQESLAQGGEEVIEVHRFATEPAKVEVSLGLTLNLGNFESARLSVGVVVPCYKEEVDGAYEWAKKWVTDRTQKEVESIRNKEDTTII